LLAALVLASMPNFSLNAAGPTEGRRMLLLHAPAKGRLTPAGRLSATNRLTLAIGLPLRNREALNALLQDLYDPASPQFRQFLTPAQFTERFGPTEQDYQDVRAFAKSHRLDVTAMHPNRVILDVAGTVADVETAFRVSLRVYQHPTEARTFRAPDTEPSVELSVPILDVEGLDDYALPHPNLKPRPAGLAASVTPQSGSAPGGAYWGRDFRSAYVPGTSLTGSGQSVGLLQFDGYYASDIAAYISQAGIATSVTLVNVPVDGGIERPEAVVAR
jgi:subtilase family serine protease